MSRLAVVDCETTGFASSDRVIEIAIVILDAKTLDTLDEFDSLINPMRDVGRTDIHGIYPSMLAAAPSFEEIVSGVAERLDGAVLVAHNLPFDARFITTECVRAGTTFDAGSGICTYSLTGEKLTSAADRYGIVLDDHHRALADARATAELLRYVVEDGLPPSQPARMPRPVEFSGTRTFRREATGERHATPLRRFLSQACYPSSQEPYAYYFEMLDWVIADGTLTQEERLLLDQQIALLGLTPAQVRNVHEAYFRSILLAVERDHRVSPDERELLSRVAIALGLEDLEIPDASAPTPSVRTGALRPGMRVCFTGEATDPDGRRIPRSELELLAGSQGLQPVKSLTKKGCDLLVAADGESSSTKARDARQYGIPVLSVAEFLQTIRS
jgi:DNA polymerase-3 subunit epsilon